MGRGRAPAMVVLVVDVGGEWKRRGGDKTGLVGRGGDRSTRALSGESGLSRGKCAVMV